MKPRGYQEEIYRGVVVALRAGAAHPVIQAATGAGKTVIAGMFIERALLKGMIRQVLVLVHRAELVKQFEKTLRAYGLGGQMGRICAGSVPDVTAPVQIAMVQTLVRRLDIPQIEPDLIITDECHHGAAATYKKIYDRWPQAMRLGLSATPARTDGKGLDHFDVIVPGPPVQQLIDEGFLSDYELMKIDLREIGMRMRGGDFRRDEVAAAADDDWCADTVRIFRDHCTDRRTLIFCSTREAARNVQQRLREAGYDVEYADGASDVASKAQRLRALERFESGDAIALCSVDILGEGYDCAMADCCIMDRPSASPIIYLQQAGRVLRPSLTGRKALIIDLCGNTERVGGGPRVPRIWTTEGVHIPGQEQGKARKQAAEPKPAKKKRVVEAQLIRVNEDAEMIIEPNAAGTGWRRASVMQAVNRCASRAEIERLAVALGYKSSWVDHMVTVFGVRR